MSIRIWEDIASQKAQVENQRKEILSAFKQRKVEDEVGMVRAEKLFKPITKLLSKQGEEKMEEIDYDIDDDTRILKNELPFTEWDQEHPEMEMEIEEDPYADLEPFDEADQGYLDSLEGQSKSEKVKDYSDFLKWLQKHGYESEDIAPLSAKTLPEKSSPGPEEIAPLAVPEELEEEVAAAAFLPGDKAEAAPPKYSAATMADKPPKYREPRENESSDLASLSRFIEANKLNPSAKMATKKSKFYGISVQEAMYKEYEIYTERAKKVLEVGNRQEAIGQKGLGPYEGKSNSERREMIAKFEKGKQTGTGMGTLINRLSLGISSIFAGNTSVKLREEIKSIAKLLNHMGVISSEQKNKVMTIK